METGDKEREIVRLKKSKRGQAAGGWKALPISQRRTFLEFPFQFSRIFLLKML
jgi:hypothetical protein